MVLWQIALLLAYGLVLGLLLLFSAHRLVMVRLYRQNHDRIPLPVRDPESWPPITVQLPVYNEYYVAERLIRRVAQLDYPRSALEIQVLDDSTDETRDVVDRCVAELRSEGVPVVCLRRENRIGYKAGALAAGMRASRGELIAVFDADFLPSADFLKRMVPHLVAGADVGMVQARWGHLNRDHSMLTKVQAIFLDGHFVMEHGARSRSGLFFNFNGTAGIWKRRCIEDAGGWQHDTLTEDLDLSYRAQMAGWRFVYLQDVVSPAELPVTVTAWKSQQFRWAKGAVQTARKLLVPLLRSDLSRGVKAEAAMHLCANTAYLLMALLVVLIFPAILLREEIGWLRYLLIDIPLCAAGTAVVSRYYILAQKELYVDWRSRVKYLPAALALGMGISFNNARGVVEALTGRTSAFQRTPKFNVICADDGWRGKAYQPERNRFCWLEASAGLYLGAVTVVCAAQSAWLPLPFLGLFCGGFLYTGLTSAWELERADSPRVAESAPLAAD